MRHKLQKMYSWLTQDVLKLPPFKVLPRDCFVISWPRSGNTWMRYMLSYALYPQSDWNLLRIEEQMPTADRSDIRRAAWKLRDRPYRIFKSHSPFRPFFLKGRVAYIIRDGRDATLSLYHYRTTLDRQNFTLSEFVQRSSKGDTTYGSWQDHVTGWMEHASDPAVLLVYYERMLEDPGRELLRVLNHFNLSASPEQIAMAVAHSSVEQVNKGFQEYAAKRSKTFSGGLGGGSGKWKEMFSASDLAVFMERAGATMERCGYKHEQAGEADSQPAARGSIG